MSKTIMSTCPKCGFLSGRAIKNVIPESNIGINPCRSCRMLGVQNSGNGASYKNGYRWFSPKRGWCIRSKQTWVLQHRVLMEEYLNRKLAPNEYVKYIDNDKRNCVIQNLKLCTRVKKRNKIGEFC